MPHPPCQPRGSNSRPCSPAVTAASPAGMAPSNARFHSPGRSRHAPSPGPGTGAVQPLNLQALSNPVGAGAEMSFQGQQQEATCRSSRQLAPSARTGARLSDGMGFETASLQLKPAMQMPAADPADLSSNDQQCLGEKMQRLETMITQLDDVEQDLSPRSSAGSTRTVATMLSSQPAAAPVDAADAEKAGRPSRGSRGSSGHSMQSGLRVAPPVTAEPASKGGPADVSSTAAGAPAAVLDAALAGPSTPTPRQAVPGDGADTQGQQKLAALAVGGSSRLAGDVGGD
jgi:hypothetical protein